VQAFQQEGALLQIVEHPFFDRRDVVIMRRYALPLYIRHVRIAEAPEPHPRPAERGKILFHEALMEVIAGPDFGMDPVSLIAHEDHDSRLIIDIGAARDLDAVAKRFVEKTLHLIDRRYVAELLVGGRRDLDGMGWARPRGRGTSSRSGISRYGGRSRFPSVM
jgi:hypothetical protein